ncbi:uncharacterized protein ColSpa_10888 [Colletotrichum spaethianum]|uniref:Uncharacterized protein n=1 Tax=Colletotrichum spaethianum TaxID=700344 RepID=A0AA37PEG0_9PEZI|nr:uncharacterized protein ColSpa_10888 [Colletotrichum spaethianum]GKT50707.1 hypothetical protein ColSpa_10888 [Colletotrichum spaethianum]
MRIGIRAFGFPWSPSDEHLLVTPFIIRERIFFQGLRKKPESRSRTYTSRLSSPPSGHLNIWTWTEQYTFHGNSDLRHLPSTAVFWALNKDTVAIG